VLLQDSILLWRGTSLPLQQMPSEAFLRKLITNQTCGVGSPWRALQPHLVVSGSGKESLRFAWAGPGRRNWRAG